VKVTLHSNHHSLTPKQRSRVHALTRQYLRCVWSASFLWWMQQKLLSGVGSGVEGGRSLKLVVAEGRMYDVETRKMTLWLLSDSVPGIVWEAVQDRCSGIAFCWLSSEDDMTSVLTRQQCLPDGRIEREVLKTGFLKCLAEKTDTQTTFIKWVSLYSINHVCWTHQFQFPKHRGS